jgi:hypothetical protein
MPHIEIDDLPLAPPALLLMLQQFAPGLDWHEVRKRIRACLRDMKEQSLAFESQSMARAEPPSPLRFEVHPHGALDLLSEHGCTDLNCRIAAAERLARSLGLIADRVWLTDHLSTEVMTLGRATNESLDRLMHHAIALAPLLPLIKAGVVRFRSPWIATCSSCSAEFDLQVEAATEVVLRSFARQIKVERKDSGGYFIRTGDFFEPPVMLHSLSNSGRPPSSRQYGEYLVAREVRQILWTAREATFTHGAVFSNSRPALAGMLQCDGRLPRNRSELRAFEDSRALDMPWVSELNPTQVVQLREEASHAIPLLREMLARAVTYNGGQSATGNASELIASLRAQAAEVKADLSAKQSKSARYWKVTYGVLGLGISAYGVATDQVLPGMGGLLPILQLLIGHKTGHESEVAKLKTRPGYVLVKAQDILAHAH